MAGEYQKKKRIASSLVIFAIVGIVFIVFELIASPAGNFPLNDDWSYAVGVKNLLESGHLRITSWTLAAAIFHVSSAALFCKIAGFSFEALRIYTLCFSGMGLALLAMFMRRMKVDWLIVLLFVLFVFSNPLYFSLSQTFMMDVPTAVLIFGSVFLLTGSWKTKGALRLIQSLAGAVLSALAVSNREVYVLVPIVYFAFVAYSSRKSNSKQNAAGISVQDCTFPSLVEAALPLVLSIAFIGWHLWWINNVTGVPFCMVVEKQYLQNLWSAGALLPLLSALMSLLRLFIYLGLLLLPFTVWSFPALLNRLELKQRTLLTLVTVELVAILPLGLLLSRNIMPLADNMIFDFGLGPILLGGNQGAWPAFAQAPRLFWQLITVFSGMGAALLGGSLAALVIALRQKARSSAPPWKYTDAVCTLLLLISFTYVLAICLRGFFDRYLIVLFLLFAVILGHATTFAPTRDLAKNTWQQFFCFAKFIPKAHPVLAVLSALFAVSIATYSLLGTHDYFAWNRARWTALDAAMSVDKIPPSKIDGGYEFNHWYVYEPGNKSIDVRKDDVVHTPDEFMLTMEPRASYVIQAAYPFPSFFWGPGHQILLLRKLN